MTLKKFDSLDPGKDYERFTMLSAGYKKNFES